MKAPIMTRKHILQISQGTVSQSARLNTNIIEALEGPRTLPQHVAEGAVVKACYVELWLSMASATVVGSYTVILAKNPGGNASPSATNMAALHDFSNKKNILFTGQGLLAPTDGGQVPVLRGWYRIPKGKQRFGLGDLLQITIRNNNATAIDVNFCGLAIFKEQT